MQQIPGVTRQEEEERLQETLTIAREKVEENKRNVKALAEELHAMQEEFDESDKEMQTLWHDTDARFKFVNQDLRRAAQAVKKPYFGRIDFTDKKLKKPEAYYIGRSVIAKDPANPEVIDWRAPIAGVYYDSNVGEATYAVKGEGRYEIDLTRKRTYEIEEGVLKDFYDSDVVANDELLTKYLAKNKKAVLGEIIATIQKEQNQVIRMNPHHNIIIQGAAGSGKTTVAMHRISYILYNFETEFAPEDFYIIGSNKVLLNYITGVLPELNVYGVQQMTMEELFCRLLYEEYDRKLRIRPTARDEITKQKSTREWFLKLEAFCDSYEESIIPREDVRMEKNHVLLLPKAKIEKILAESKHLSRADKIERLTEHLMAKLENETSGKYYTYTAAEKDKLTRYYSTYFGKREWKGSIYDLYYAFLKEQNCPYDTDSLDLYDLAALAYLYKRLKEEDIIREAGHVIIDEAQDFGMMVYSSLKACLSKCTYTIMGDVSQNIYMGYGLNDWSELCEVMLPGDFDYFGLLRKSYRNTVEISKFATDILCHGTSLVYPVEPIIRHGKAVEVKGVKEERALVEETTKVLTEWVNSGMDTIAVICPDEEKAAWLSKQLPSELPILSMEGELEFKEGIMVLSLEYTKGLEFDAVLLYDVSKENYPVEDGTAKRLYVAATRALHELTVLYQGEVSGLIAEPVSKEALARLTVEPILPKKMPFQMPEDTRTKEEIYEEEALLGHQDMKERHTYGPKRIVVPKPVPKPVVKPVAATETGVTRSAETGAGKPGSPAMPETAKMQSILKRPIANSSQERAGNRSKVQPSGSPSTFASLRPAQVSAVGKQIREKERQEAKAAALLSKRPPLSMEFGDMPSGDELNVPGHSKVDYSVMFVKKGKNVFDFVSKYGVLRLQPVAKNRLRVLFTKDVAFAFPEKDEELCGEIGKVRTRENPNEFELALEGISVILHKRTGELTFYNSKKMQILAEHPKEPRLIMDDRAWQFFDWKKEAFIAKGIDNLRNVMVDKTARYISFGKDYPNRPGIASPKGYDLIFPARVKTLLCTIPAYGSYIRFEDRDFIDYYVSCK